MRDIRQKRAERLGLVMDAEMRATIEAEALRRDTSMSSVIRSILRDRLPSMSGRSEVQRAQAAT